MKIVVLDGYTVNPGDLTWKDIYQYGEVEMFDRTSLEDEEAIQKRIADAEIVVTNKTPISRNTMDICQNIKFIAVTATGYNIVDVSAAAEKGILVANVPTYGTDSVAQFAISLLLEICGHAGHHSDEVHNGKWGRSADWCFWDYPLIELAGKTIGIIGFGRIGQRTGEIAKALGMEVLAYSRSIKESGKRIAEYVSLDRLLEASDVIALHCPLSAETNKIINSDTIAKMKDGVIIINNSRGQLIDEYALSDALKSGKVYAAAVDVVSFEPIKNNNPLLEAPNCIITPHISWAPKESRERIIACTLDNIKGFMEGKPLNIVNA